MTAMYTIQLVGSLLQVNDWANGTCLVVQDGAFTSVALIAAPIENSRLTSGSNSGRVMPHYSWYSWLTINVMSLLIDLFGCITADVFLGYSLSKLGFGEGTIALSSRGGEGNLCFPSGSLSLLATTTDTRLISPQGTGGSLQDFWYGC